MDSATIVQLFVFLCIFSFCIIMFVIASSRKAKGNANIYKLKNEKGFICGGRYRHTVGLPISEGVHCQVLFFYNRIEVRFNSMKFNLDRDKIIDICLKTDVEIQKQYVSSAGGAVGGALLFGPVGALIGGRTKEKRIRNATSYLIITYKNDEEIKYMGFDVTGVKSSAKRFVYVFKNSNSNNSEMIDLGSSASNVVGNNNAKSDVSESDVEVAEHTVLQETPTDNINQYSKMSTNSTVVQKKKMGCGTITLIVIGAVLLGIVFLVIFTNMISSGRSTKTTTQTSQVTTVEKEESKNVIFDVNAFIKDGKTVTEDELIKKIGKPDETEDWNYTTSAGEKYPIRTLYYGNYEYKFNNGALVRITIYEPMKFEGKDDFLEMFNITKTKNSDIKDTGVAYRVTNSNIYDLWVGYDSKTKKTQWVHISYSNLFDK